MNKQVGAPFVEPRRELARRVSAFYHPFAQLATSFDELVPVADA
jgi:hypothetical protein